MTSLRNLSAPLTSIDKRLQVVSYLAAILVIVNCFLLGLVPIDRRWKTSQNTGLKLAYATLLTSSDAEYDEYLLSARILNYQLLHSRQTGTSSFIPFLILVTPDVPEWKRSNLTDEGALIVEVDKLDTKRMTPLFDRWRDVMVKLRLFQLTEYDRILFLDADTFLLKSLDGVFWDSAVKPRNTKSVAKVMSDEAGLPDSYLFATLPEVQNKIHSYPPVRISYFNAGFFLFSPSKKLFNYYISLLELERRFDSTYPEQNLLNYAHRENGNMPWLRMSHHWNINLPNSNDVEKGVASVHSKLWAGGNVLEPTEPVLRKRWQLVRDEMERFYAERNNGRNVKAQSGT